MSTSSREVKELQERLLTAFDAGDRAAVVAAVHAAVDDGLPIETLYREVLTPLLEKVGREWQTGARSIWQEHFATQAVRTAVESLYPQVLERRAQAGGTGAGVTVAFFCPEEETHDLGLRMLCDLFDLRGFDTLYVGASTPTEDMLDAVRRSGAVVVCLSASSHYTRALLRHAVVALEGLDPPPRILVGGAAFRQAAPEWEPYLVSDLDAVFEGLMGEAGEGGR